MGLLHFLVSIVSAAYIITQAKKGKDDGRGVTEDRGVEGVGERHRYMLAHR